MYVLWLRFECLNDKGSMIIMSLRHEDIEIFYRLFVYDKRKSGVHLNRHSFISCL